MSAFDSSVLVTLLRAGAPGDVLKAQTALEQADAAGSLIISPPVYAEVSASPGMTERFLDRFLKETGVAVEWRLSKDVWRDAARAFSAYANRRRRDKSDKGPRRLLADFVIGAHALRWADRFVTFDKGIYRTAFPDLDTEILR